MSGVTLQRKQWRINYSKLHSIKMGDLSLPLTQLHSSVAQLSIFTKTKMPPEVLLQHTLRPKTNLDKLSWYSEKCTPRSLWQRETSWLWESVCLEKWHFLLSRSCSNRERNHDHPETCLQKGLRKQSHKDIYPSKVLTSCLSRSKANGSKYKALALSINIWGVAFLLECKLWVCLEV